MSKPHQPSAGATQAKPEGAEGEGSYTSTRRYNEHVKEHLEHGDVEEEAKQAKQALEGDERAELEDAERRAKRGPVPPKPEHSQR
jgi:hypothetical protein